MIISSNKLLIVSKSKSTSSNLYKLPLSSFIIIGKVYNRRSAKILSISVCYTKSTNITEASLEEVIPPPKPSHTPVLHSPLRNAPLKRGIILLLLLFFRGLIQNVSQVFLWISKINLGAATTSTLPTLTVLSQC